MSRPRASLTVLAALLLALLPAISAPGSESEDYKIIARLMKEGAYQTALAQGRSYLSAYAQGGHRARVAGWVGVALLKEGDAEGALPLLTEALAGLPPKEAEDLALRKAQAEEALGRHDAALATLRAFRPATEGQRAEVLRTQAAAYKALGNTEAWADAAGSIPAKAATPADRFESGQALLALGQDAKAVPVLLKVLEEEALGSDDARKARIGAASALYRLKRYGEAVETLTPLAAGGNDPEAALLSAWALRAEGHPAQAYDLARKAVPLTGWEEAAALVPVRSAAAEGDVAATLEAAKACLERFPKGPAAASARLLASRALEDRGDWASALEVLEACIPDISDPSERALAAAHGARLAWERQRNPERASRWLRLAAAAADTEESRSVAALAQARFDWERGETTAALKGLADLLERDKSTAAAPGAYLLLGSILSAEGNAARSEEALDVVIESFPDAPEYPEAILLEAEGRMSRGATEGLAGLLALLGSTPLSPGEAVRRDRLSGRLALELGQWDAARALFASGSAAVLPPETADRMTYMGALAALGAGDVDAALEAAGALRSPLPARRLKFRAAATLERTGDAGRALAILDGLAREGEPDGALALWKAADLRLRTDGEASAGMDDLARLADWPGGENLRVLAQRRLEMILLASKGPEAALSAMPAFLNAQPIGTGGVEGLLREARILSRAGRSIEARRAYAAYLQREPDGPGAAEAAGFLARDAARRGDLPAARAALEKAAATPAVLLQLGDICYRMRDMAAAQSAYERALATGAKVLSAQEALTAHLRAGTAAKIQGRTEAAVGHLEAYAGGEKPDDASREDLFSTALWLQGRGRFDAALKALEALNARYRDAAVGFNVGYTLELMGNQEQALDAYLRVAYGSANPQWALTARYRAAELMVALGRRDDAVALYRELATRTEGSIQGDYARERLKALEAQAAPPPKSAPSKPAPKEARHAAPPATR